MEAPRRDLVCPRQPVGGHLRRARRRFRVVSPPFPLCLAARRSAGSAPAAAPGVASQREAAADPDLTDEPHSKRAYQEQFRRWNFPPKQNPAHKNDRLVARVRELWERNLPQAEMLRVLADEGFEIKHRELMRVRRRNRWLLRVANPTDGAKSATPDLRSSGSEDDEEEEEDDDDDGEGSVHPAPLDQVDSPLLDSPLAYGASLGSPMSVDSGATATKQERRRRLRAESDEQWHSKKRRRRTRAWAGLPADPPGPPRFPSEMTLEQSRDRLGLDKTLYQSIRTRFLQICAEQDVVKKTLAGAEKWEAMKGELVLAFPHLGKQLHGEQADMESKKLALDVICTDVTKRMRTTKVRLTIAETKNLLGVNPEQSREIRNTFYAILKDDHFKSKLEAGPDHWQELKRRWIQGSPLLGRILGAGDADPRHEEKLGAIDALADDVIKRLRDDRARRNPAKKRSPPPAPEPAPEPAPAAVGLTVVDVDKTPEEPPMEVSEYVSQVSQMSLLPGTPGGQMLPMALQASPHHLQEHSPQLHSQPRLLPSAVLDPQGGLPLDAHHHHHHHHHHLDSSLLMTADAQAFMQQQLVAHFAGPVFPPPSLPSVAVYFRLAPGSTYIVPEAMWVGALASHPSHQPSLDELRHAAVAKFPGAVCALIQGVMTRDGAELPVMVRSDMQLSAFWNGEMEIGNDNPTFLVQLMVGAWDSLG